LPNLQLADNDVFLAQVRNSNIASRDLASLVARTLFGAWRESPVTLDISKQELSLVLEPLLGSGAGPLGWCKIRHSELKSLPSAFQFQQAYRKHTLEAARHERDIQAIFTLLRSNNIEPVLIKGWSIARLYPEKGMRPYDDTDLVVRRDQYSNAQTIVREQKLTEFDVDLHRGLEEYGFDNEDDFFVNSQLVKLGDVDVRVPALEDNLRISCVHFLRHGAFRPLWLCDVALAVESRPADFDWDRCLGGNKRVADWIACTIGLAHQLLGARVDDTPVAHRAENLPRGLLPNVLKQWEKPFARDHGVARHRAPMSSYLRNPAGLVGDLLRRWPNGIEATVYVRGPFNELPRFPFQIGECIGRAARFVARLPKSLGERDGFG
jgi:hypothetical protein